MPEPTYTTDFAVQIALENLQRQERERKAAQRQQQSDALARQQQQQKDQAKALEAMRLGNLAAAENARAVQAQKNAARQKRDTGGASSSASRASEAAATAAISKGRGLLEQAYKVETEYKASPEAWQGPATGYGTMATEEFDEDTDRAGNISYSDTPISPVTAPVWKGGVFNPDGTITWPSGTPGGGDTGNGTPPTGNGTPPTGNGTPPSGNGTPPSGNGTPPSGNGTPSSGTPSGDFFDIFSPYRNEQRYAGPTVLEVDAPSRGLLDYSQWMPPEGVGLRTYGPQRAMFANQGAAWQPQWQGGGLGYQPPQGVTYAPDYQTVDTTPTSETTSTSGFTDPLGGQWSSYHDWYMNSPKNPAFFNHLAALDRLNAANANQESLLNAPSSSWQGGGRIGMDQYGLLQPQEVQVEMGSGYTYPDIGNPYPGLVDPTFAQAFPQFGGGTGIK